MYWANHCVNQPVENKSSHHIETSHLIWTVNLLVGFDMIKTLVVHGLLPKNKNLLLRQLMIHVSYLSLLENYCFFAKAAIRKCSVKEQFWKFHPIYRENNCIGIVFFCSENQWTGFYKIGASVMKELRGTLRSEAIFGNWELFENDEKCFLYYLKCSFRSQNI